MITPESAEPADLDAMTLHCPMCPRRWWQFRLPARVYRRVTPWVWRMATFRCDGCSYEHRFTAQWAEPHRCPPGKPVAGGES